MTEIETLVPVQPAQSNMVIIEQQTPVQPRPVQVLPEQVTPTVVAPANVNQGKPVAMPSNAACPVQIDYSNFSSVTYCEGLKLLFVPEYGQFDKRLAVKTYNDYVTAVEGWKSRYMQLAKSQGTARDAYIGEIRVLNEWLNNLYNYRRDQLAPYLV